MLSTNPCGSCTAVAPPVGDRVGLSRHDVLPDGTLEGLSLIHI